MNLVEKLSYRRRRSPAPLEKLAMLLFFLGSAVVIVVLSVTRSSVHQTSHPAKTPPAPKRAPNIVASTSHWEKVVPRPSHTIPSPTPFPKFPPIEGVLRDLGVTRVSQCTELLLSNGMQVRTTIFNPTPNLPKEAMLVEWLSVDAKVVQRGVYDPTMIRVRPNDIAKNADVYEAIISPDLEDKIYSSLKDGSLQIRPHPSKENPVEVAMRVQGKAGSLGNVELVPFFR